MSVWENLDVDKRIEKYRTDFPKAPRAEIRRFIRLEYELECAKQGIDEERAKLTFLRKLDRKLEVLEFPELTATTDRRKTEEENIMDAIKEHFPVVVLLRSRTKYRPTFNEDEDALKDAATRSGNDVLDKRFRKKFFKLKKKWFEENNSASTASKKIPIEKTKD
jgi:hypothetical protein